MLELGLDSEGYVGISSSGLDLNGNAFYIKRDLILVRYKALMGRKGNHGIFRSQDRNESEILLQTSSYTG